MGRSGRRIEGVYFMIWCNDKHFKIIGYEQSTILQEIEFMFREEIREKNLHIHMSVITPEDFIALEDKDAFQYLVMFNKDLALRDEVIAIIEEEQLDCVSAMHKTAWKTDTSKIGKGTVIGPFASLYVNASIGDHCVLEAYSMIGHYTNVGNNVHIRPNVMISGSCNIGNNCVFNTRSTVLEHIDVCDDVLVGGMTGVRRDITESGMYVGTSAKRIGDWDRIETIQ